MAQRPTLLSRLVKRVLFWLYRTKGWEIEGGAPEYKKCIITGAPHTSNWDFIFFLGVTVEIGIRPRFLGKTSLFRRPLTRFMVDMGGVPIDRKASHNYVEQVVEAFAAEDDMLLVVAPEGSRGGSGKWRSGFYHMALGAGVPIIPAWVDQANMRGGIGEPIWPTGDYAADMARIAAFYRSKMPDHPKLAGLYAMAEELSD